VKLIRFNVYDFRSINSSGEIKVSKITSLVGRNESGKTNLLLALHSLNPAGGIKDLSAIKDFPRHRRLTECNDRTKVVDTAWELDADEQAQLVKMFPRAKGVTRVNIGRWYKGNERWADFLDLPSIDFSLKEVSARIRKLTPVILAAAEKLEEPVKERVQAAADKLRKDVTEQDEPNAWAKVAAPAIAAFRQALGAAAIVPEAREEGMLAELEELAASIAKDEPAFAAARTWAIGRLPVFIYVEDYPELAGHQNIAEYLARKKANPSQLTDADRNFEKMCKVADLNPEQLQNLFAANDHETRNQLTNRAGAVVTTELRRLWKDRELKVRFNVDAVHLDTFISDPNAIYDVEVNLNERSRGLKWFFSFYVTFSADTKGGNAENAILLLDEPGIHLHATSQGDLLRHLAADFKNQIIYTTHSPFMVPTENLDAIRTVNIDQETGTTVTNDPSGDARTLFPLQAALGFNLAQSLFIGPNNLVIEGVTDFWLISAVSDYLHGVGRKGLPKELTLTPAGGAQKIPYMVALLTSEKLNVLVLLDDEKQARGTKEELVKSKLIRDENVTFVTQGFPAGGPSEADIEDLLDSDVYTALVEESYKDELRGKKLNLNAKIPRIVKRYEDAFSALGMEFHKTRPARLLLNKMANRPETIMTASTCERLERLCGVIGEALRKHQARSPAAFR
jgi:predicted ATPase